MIAQTPVSIEQPLIVGSGCPDARRGVVLDMTPICVNKTAIYHIAMDTYHALQTYDVRLQFRGEIKDLPQGNLARQFIADAFYKDIEIWARETVHGGEIANLLDSQNQEIDVPRIYFDPIYTLYRPLSKSDIVFVLDLTTLTNPEWHNPSVAFIYEYAFRRLLSSSARIVSISEHCTTALRANFSIPESDIMTVPLYLRRLSAEGGVRPSAELESGRFFLFVGSMELRKNLIGLIRAFSMSGLGERWKLAIAGGKGHGWEAINEAGKESSGVELLGFVSEEELSWLYHHAAAFAYPSFLEGFGLPLLEAMAHGLPCLASTTGASKEVCGDLGILVDPYDMQSIVKGLIRCANLSDDFNAELRTRSIDRAHQFTFERYFAKILQSLTSA